MDDVVCTVCGYCLPADAAAVCPECGSGAAARAAAAARKRRAPARWSLIAHGIVMAPAWLALVVLLSGWTVAHVVIGVPYPSAVESGDYVVLDVLGVVAVLAALPAMVSMLAVLVTLPATVMLNWLPSTGDDFDVRRRRTLLALVLAVPAVVLIFWFRSLDTWLPD